MIKFNVGARRRANDGVRTTHLRNATDLVQRTLAQHGLHAPAASRHSSWSNAIRQSLGQQPLAQQSAEQQSSGRVFADLPSNLGKVQFGQAAIPEGAQYQRHEFSCAAGNRAYRMYVPASAAKDLSGIVMMLHGCTQTPEDFAVGTGMNALAEIHRFAVIYPQQSRGNNAQSCWNWFSPGDQKRDRGEPAILAGIARKEMEEHGVSSDTTFVAGLSAGGAMAVILGETYPDVFSAVGSHSGLPVGAAKDVPSAFAAMAGNIQARPETPTNALCTRTIVFHGSADATVHPSNSEQIVRRAQDRTSPLSVVSRRKGQSSGRSFSRKIMTSTHGVVELEYWVVDELGHAWSGGQPDGSYTEIAGPDASAEMIRFFFDGKE